MYAYKCKFGSYKLVERKHTDSPVNMMKKQHTPNQSLFFLRCVTQCFAFVCTKEMCEIVNEQFH